jgi:hypothetical protein
MEYEVECGDSKHNYISRFSKVSSVNQCNSKMLYVYWLYLDRPSPSSG